MSIKNISPKEKRKFRYKPGIYAIINLINQKIYIGSTKDLSERKYEHFRALKRGTHFNKYLQHEVNEYKIENFQWTILQFCKEEDRLRKERCYICYYNSSNPYCGYNISIKTKKKMKSKKPEQKITIITGRNRSICGGHVIIFYKKEKINKSEYIKSHKPKKKKIKVLNLYR